MTTFSNKDLKHKIVDIYDTKIKKVLESYAVEISDIFETILKNKLGENPNTYSLTHDNAGYLGKYYKVTHRVKSGLSLGEKLVKKDDLLRLKYTFGFEGGQEYEEKINNHLLERYTDLIGIKVLGDLQQDTQNIYRLIKENKNKFKKSTTRYITFETLDKQNEKMKNGMEIIKIDCIYHRESEKIKFEFQIKSQLMSAWGDMEHQQFYKNNRFSLVRKSNEPIMSDIGQLLEKTDELLLTIRLSENKFNENEELWKFTVDIQKEFTDRLNEILEVNVASSLTEIADILLLLFKNIKPDKENYKFDMSILEKIKEGEFDLEDSDDLFINNYIKHRKLHFKLQILEIIILVWYGSIEEIDNSKDNYISFVKKYIKGLLDILHNQYEIDRDSELKFDDIFYTLISHSTKYEVFRDFTYYKEIIAYYKFTKDIYKELEEAEEDVFPVDVFYLINYLFSRNLINGETIEEIEIEQGDIDINLLDGFFDYLKKEAKGLDSKFLKISNLIHLRLRRGF
ncbi:hypothetical protein [Bacillus sp. NEB1478]|uniref:hypothetical protein n=1 Tax=Bacillus sp. NEB1478 TaxID=3073816 RepID=UPI002873D7D2|nr:hypothetical protein [Bacillus sp. NEB1478]WNB91847.1 hypothetical protein RGB74_18565 [Bacillus sp. NEB1478]